MPSAKYDPTDGRIRGRKLQARRLRLWSKDPRCARCGRLTNFPHDFELDHKVPLFKGGKDLDENCQILCISPCHEDKTNEDLDRRITVAIGNDGWPM